MIRGVWAMKKNRTPKTVADSICRIHKSAYFTMLCNCFIRSTRLSSDTIFLFAKILSLPPSWNFTKSGLAATCEIGITALERMLRELEDWGYLTIRKLTPDQTENGRYKYVYDFYEYSEKDDTITKYDVVLETYTAENAVLYRTEKKNNYFSVSNKILWGKADDMKKYMKAMGVMLKSLSLPSCWRFSLDGIVAVCKEGRTAVKSALDYLIELGYLVRTQLLPNETVSRHIEYVYEFFEKALSKEDAEKKSKKTKKAAKKAAKEHKAEKPKKSKKKTSEQVKKQGVENLSAVEQSVVGQPLADNELSNKEQNKKENQQLCYKSSINSPTNAEVCKAAAVEKSEGRMTDRYDQEEIDKYTELVKQNIGYWQLGDWLTVDGRDGYKEADNIVGFIVDEICSPLPYTTLRGQAFPRSVIQSKMLQANIYMVESVLEKMAKIDDIKDYRRYFISSLYNEVLTYHFNDGCESRWAEYAVARDFDYAL